MSITTILFDVGGVLIAPLDAEAVWARRELLAQSLGFASADAMWLRFYDSEEWRAAKTGGMTHVEMWESLLRPHGYETPEAQATLVEELHRGEGLDPDMARLVVTLHRDYQLGILSNWDDRLELLLDHHEISQYFDVILNSHRIGVAKPDEETYRLALDRLGVAPHELFFIDDRERNTTIAEELGIATHVFRDLPGLVGELEGRGMLREGVMGGGAR